MKQPLVTRPAYQQGPKATAELPEGPPADRGRSLDDDVPGYKTFTKPLDDNNTSDPAPEQSIYRTDSPKDLAKHQEGDDSIDQSHSSPSYLGLGGRDPRDRSLTRYPYRDDKPNQKNADSDFVAELHMLERKEPLVLRYQDRTAARVAAWSDMTSRVAATAEQILAGLNPKFVERAKAVQATLKRADIRNMRWIFSVTSSSDKTYAVKLKAVRPRKNTTKFSKMDLEMACSCPAWQWQGPEYHATSGPEYQLGKLQGTASTPDIRDLKRQNKVCKHVAAVLNMTRRWEVPASR